mgnify:CR=1 FL=1
MRDEFIKKFRKFLVSKNQSNFLIISLGSFLLSLFFINILFELTYDEKLSSKLTLVLVFLYNFYFIKKKFDIDQSIKLLILLTSLSLISRLIELQLFVFLFATIKDINISWILTLILSFSIKFFLYPFLILKLRNK